MDRAAPKAQPELSRDVRMQSDDGKQYSLHIDFVLWTYVLTVIRKIKDRPAILMWWDR